MLAHESLSARGSERLAVRWKSECGRQRLRFVLILGYRGRT